MKNKFSIELCGDVDYEGMVVDVSYNMMTIASINYDKGIDHLEIALAPYGINPEHGTFPLEEFQIILEKAKALAIQCAKEDEK